MPRRASHPLADNRAASPASDGYAYVELDEAATIDDIEREVAQRVAPLRHRVPVVVNYDHFSIRPELMDDYQAMVQRLTERYYERVTRYAASSFVKARLS